MNNQIKNAFDDVHASDELKRNTKIFLSEKIQQKEKKPITMQRKFAPVLAGLVLVALLGGGFYSYSTPVSAISIDVNPSIEIGVNQYDRVVSVKGYNTDGISIVDAVDIKNMNYSKAIDTLMNCNEMKNYLQNDNTVSVTVTGKSDKKNEEISENVSSCKYINSSDVECVAEDKEEVKAAHDAGLSFGKYQAYLELKALDPDITAQDVQGLTMHDIKEKINALSGDDSQSMQYGKGQHTKGQGKK